MQRSAAATAMSLVDISGGAWRRSRMPVRWMIQSASQPSDARASFVTTLSGTKLPVPTICTPVNRRSGERIGVKIRRHSWEA